MNNNTPLSDYSAGLVCASTADAAGTVRQCAVGAFVCQDAYLAPDAPDHTETVAADQQQEKQQRRQQQRQQQQKF